MNPNFFKIKKQNDDLNLKLLKNSSWIWKKLLTYFF